MKKSILLALSVATLVVQLPLSVRAQEGFPTQATPEKVIGVDSRQLVSDTTSAVNRTIVRITFEGYDQDGNWGPAFGSGVMVAPDTVLTAAHVLYDLD